MTSLQQSLQIALKEWASVCAALETGRQIILLRKGGIYEAAGEFELEHPRFLLFPTYLHQNLNMLKTEAHGGFESMNAEPSEIRISAAGVVSHIVQLRSRAQMDAIEAEHIWAAPLIEMRFNYKPRNPLYLMLVRAYRLPEPVTVAMSWTMEPTAADEIAGAAVVSEAPSPAWMAVTVELVSLVELSGSQSPVEPR